MGSGGDKSKVAQLIQNCESHISGARKYSSFDSLKDRKTSSCFLQDPRLDMVSSCHERLKSAGSDDTVKTVDTLEMESSCSDITLKMSNCSEDNKSGAYLSEKSIGSDDVFKTVESFGRSSKKSSELEETFKDNHDRSQYKPTHIRNKSNESDSVFMSDSEVIDGKVSSFKAKIEMFSKVGLECNRPKPPVNRGIKPKVPIRTSTLSSENPVPPKVQLAALMNTCEKESQLSESVIIAYLKEGIQRERGKLDKSFSTPAYDFSADISASDKISFHKQKELADSKLENRSDSAFEDYKSDLESLSGREEDTKTNDNSISASIPSSNSEEFVDLEKEVHGQIVETINKHLLNLNDETDNELKWKDKNAAVDVAEDPDEDIESKLKIGKLLDKINSSLAEHRKEIEKETRIRQVSPGGADLSKTISQVCKEDILQTYNPGGFLINRPISMENISEQKSKNTVIPVPPRVRITPPVVVEERPNCLSDVALIAPMVPEAPKRKPVSNVDLSDKVITAPATFPRQRLENRRPLTPPEPPPRPTPPAPVIQAKGACHKAIMAAKSISKTTKVGSPRAVRKKNPYLASKLWPSRIRICDTVACSYSSHYSNILQ